LKRSQVTRCVTELTILWFVYSKSSCYVGPCHHGMARPRFVDRGDCFHLWRLAATVLNRQLRQSTRVVLQLGRWASG
jgi:hypothetical protein